MVQLTPLFEPLGIQKLIEKLPTNDDLVLANRFSRIPYIGNGQTVSFDIIKHRQQMSRPNVRGAKAHLIGQMGRGTKSFEAIYLREAKQFDYALLKLLRTPGELNRANAEQHIAREVQELNERQERFLEYCWWGVMTGSLTLYYGDANNVGLQAPVAIDYQLPAANKPTVGTSWASATPMQILADIRAWRKIVEDASGVTPREVYASETVIDYVFDAWAANGDGTAFEPGSLMSDRMRDEYGRTGTVPGQFMEMTWKRTRTVYDSDNLGTKTPFFGEKSLIMGDFTTNRPLYLYETEPTAAGAPEGKRGKFTKTWVEEDPDTRFWMQEWGFLPVDERPDQRVYVADVTA